MFKKVLTIFILIMGCAIIDNVSAECSAGNGVPRYVIKFVTNGGNELENVELCTECSDFMNAQLPTTTKDGYSFFGWYADEELTIPVSVSKNWNRVPKEIVRDNEGCATGEIMVTLYAGWISDSCPFQATGGSRYNIKFVYTKEPIDDLNFLVMLGRVPEETLPIPESENDSFLGWYIDPDFTLQINSLQDDWNTLNQYAVYKIGENECPSQTGEINLYAKWKSMECPIKYGGTGTVFLFETNGGDKIDNISICDTCADALTAWDSTNLPNPTKDGYTFEGWYADKDLTIKIESIKDENIKFDEKYDENGCSDGSRYTTLYAKWDEITAKSNDEASTADVDNTGKNISMFLMIISGLLIISGTVMYIVNLNSKKKN